MKALIVYVLSNSITVTINKKNYNIPMDVVYHMEYYGYIEGDIIYILSYDSRHELLGLEVYSQGDDAEYVLDNSIFFQGESYTDILQSANVDDSFGMITKKHRKKLVNCLSKFYLSIDKTRVS